MLADAQRLRSQSFAPLARIALMKALSLRFGVLLTPAFWSTPIKRDLMIGDAGAQLGESEHQREAEAVQRAEAAVKSVDGVASEVLSLAAERSAQL